MIDSLAAASTRPVVGVLADNSPEPEVEAIARNAGFDYLRLSNRGYGAAANAAVQALPDSVAWILVTNPDVVFHPGSIDSLIKVAESDPAIGEVGPRIYDADGSIYPSARAVPSLRMGIGHALLGKIRPENRWTTRYLQNSDLESREIRSVGWLSGACLLLKREAFDLVGGFDEKYFMYFEDVDLGYRLSKAGFSNVYDPVAEIEHIGAHSTSGESERMIKAHHASASLFIARKYPGFVLAPLRLMLNAGLRIRSSIERMATAR